MSASDKISTRSQKEKSRSNSVSTLPTLSSGINNRKGNSDTRSDNIDIPSEETVAPVDKSATSSKTPDGIPDTQWMCKLDSMLAHLENRIYSAIAGVESRLSDKIDSVAQGLNHRLDSLNNDIVDLKTKCSTLEKESEDFRRILRLNDAIVRGIPVMPAENPHEIICDISKVIKHNLSPFIEAFRLKRKTHRSNNNNYNHTQPLIIRFSCSNEKRAFFSALRAHSHLKLNELKGFTSDARIFINESLTPHNNTLLREAVILFRQRKVSSVYSNNGFVYVKLMKDDPAVRICDLNQLRTLVATASAASNN